jgi:hypothetical protein
MRSRNVIHPLGLAALGIVLGVLVTTGSSEGGQAKASGYFTGQPGQAAPDGITVTGVGHVRVRRPAKRSDRTIRLAVAAAQRAAFPRAVADARAHAKAVADSLGLTVGSVDSVTETGDTYSSGVFGRFGAGRYCGVVRRRVFGRDTAGRRAFRRIVRRRGCVVPRQSVVILTIRYEKG